MQVSVETTKGLERKLTVTVDVKQIDGAALVKMKELARTQRMNGFRPGKIPLNVIKKRFGSHVRQEVIYEAMQRTFYEAVVKEKLQPAGAPKIEPTPTVEGKDLEFVATFEVYPEVTIADLSKIPIEKPNADVSDDDLNEMLKTLGEQQANWVETKRKAKLGDQVIVDFVGTIDGEAFEGGKANKVKLVLGQKEMIDGFEEQLEGASADETIEIKVTFPEDYQTDEVAGKNAVLTTKIRQVNKKEDLRMGELAEKLGVKDGKISTMKEDVRKNMQRELSQVIAAKVKQQVMDALVDAHDFDIPQSLLEQEIEQQKRRALEQYAGKAANLPDLPNELFTTKATKRVKLGLVVSEIIKQHKVEADKDKVRVKLEELASVYEQPEEVINYYLSDQSRLNDVEQLVMEDAVIELVEGLATVTEKTMTFDELMNPSKEAESGEKSKTSEKNKTGKKLEKSKNTEINEDSDVNKEPQVNEVTK